jgi:starvation-inducible outer membrane lipoprotein
MNQSMSILLIALLIAATIRQTNAYGNSFNYVPSYRSSVNTPNAFKPMVDRYGGIISSVNNQANRLLVSGGGNSQGYAAHVNVH